MKKIISVTISLLLVFAFIFCLAACESTDQNEDLEAGNSNQNEGLWENATYKEDTTLGNGSKTATVVFEVGENKITFTIKTDAEKLGAALHEHKLIEGNDGLYTKINGITADYNVDKSYWAFYINGEYAMAGIDDTPIDQTATYSLVYTK